MMRAEKITISLQGNLRGTREQDISHSSCDHYFFILSHCLKQQPIFKRLIILNKSAPIYPPKPFYQEKQGEYSPCSLRHVFTTQLSKFTSSTFPFMDTHSVSALFICLCINAFLHMLFSLPFYLVHLADTYPSFKIQHKHYFLTKTFLDSPAMRCSVYQDSLYIPLVRTYLKCYVVIACYNCLLTS